VLQTGGDNLFLPAVLKPAVKMRIITADISSPAPEPAVKMDLGPAVKINL